MTIDSGRKEIQNHAINGWLAHKTLFLCILVAAVVCWYFHNRFWSGPDDGYFIYIAERIIDGDILHRDIQEMHPGAIHFVNAFFLKLTGGDPVGLRYPLVKLTLIQVILGYLIAQKWGKLAAIAAASSMLAFGFLQYINPTPNWYTLTLAITLLYICLKFDVRSQKTVILLGFLVGAAFLMRQLTGVFIAMGLTTYLFLHYSSESSDERPITGSIILLILAVALGIYVIKSANEAGLLFFGIWPLAILVVAAKQCRVRFPVAFKLMWNLTFGAAISALPLIFYHVTQGSLSNWFHDVFIVPLDLIGLDFFDDVSYIMLLMAPIMELVDGNFFALTGLVLWGSILILPIIVGVTTIKRLLTKNTAIPAAGIFGSFYALVSVHYEIPIYLTYSTGILCLAAIVLFARKGNSTRLGIAIIILSISTIYFNAAQPLQRGVYGIAANDRQEIPNHDLVGTSIKVSQEEAEAYQIIVDLIDRCTAPTDTIYVYPMNTEIYALSGRKSPFGFVMSSLGLRSDEDVENNAQKIITADNNTLIFHRLEDKYNTEFADQLFNKVAAFYKFIGTVDGMDVYNRRGHALANACVIPPAQNSQTDL